MSLKEVTSDLLKSEFCFATTLRDSQRSVCSTDSRLTQRTSHSFGGLVQRLPFFTPRRSVCSDNRIFSLLSNQNSYRRPSIPPLRQNNLVCPGSIHWWDTFVIHYLGYATKDSVCRTPMQLSRVNEDNVRELYFHSIEYGIALTKKIHHVSPDHSTARKYSGLLFRRNNPLTSRTR